MKTSKLLEARENGGDQVVMVFSLHLIGWEDGASFLDRSQSEVKAKQSRITLDTQLKVVLNGAVIC